MKDEKLPEPDGITKEFYLQFWTTIKTELTQVINNALLFDNIPESWLEARITLIHKKNEKENLKNWRPISLLNTDYKIMAKILESRLKVTLGKVIGNYQKCSLPYRYIQDIHLNIEAALEYSKEKTSDAYLIAIDNLKAFDMVNQNFLFQIMRKINLNPRVVNLLSKIYNGMISRIYVNGVTTENIRIRRGIRQGCPMSMLLYALNYEPLARKITRNRSIQGLRIGKMEYKLDQYADDSTLFVMGIQSIRETMKTYETFEKATGQKINQAKTEILPINRSSSNHLKRTQYAHLEKHHIKILGIYFGHNHYERT